MKPSGGIPQLTIAVLGVLLAAGCGGGTSSRADHVLGAVPPRSPVRFVLVLRLDEPALRTYLGRVGNPQSREYRHFLTAAEFGRRFGPSRAALTVIERRLATRGVRAVPDVQRTSLEAVGSAAAVDRLFGTKLEEFRASDGMRFRAPLGRPRIPRAFAGTLTAAAGLSTRPVVASFDIPHPATGMSPTDLAKAYDIDPLRSRGFLGAGQTIAIWSLAGSVTNADEHEFESHFHLSGPPVLYCVEADGNDPRSPRRAPCSPTVSVNDKSDGENALDVDTVRGIAPQAQILDWITRFTDQPTGAREIAVDVGRGIEEITQDGRAKIVSISYGVCDSPRLANGKPWLDPGDRAFGEQELKAAYATGVNVFVSSGDQGAYACQRFDPTDERPTVDWPGDSPWVISVGGTRLSTKRDGTYFEEAGWEDILNEWGGGGGTNPIDTKPDWQRAPGVDGGPKRVLPDVSADADVVSGPAVISGSTTPVPDGGTSAASPFWAATAALLAQYVAAGGGGKLPNLDPALYELARSRQPLPPFHDVVKGGNRRDQAGPGWDYSTGLGSPDVHDLARDLLRQLAR
jgi:kumamolisin